MSTKDNFTTIVKPEKDVYKDICNAIECTNLATNIVSINAGSFGIVDLKVCSNCVNIFQSDRKAQGSK